MFSKILVPYDVSPSAEDAFDMAVRMLKGGHGTLHVLSVVRPMEIAEDVGTEADMEHARLYYAGHFPPLSRRAKAQGIHTDFHVRVGHPGQQIVDFAGELGVDLIVMGHRGRSAIERWLVGSVAKVVIDHANCPVLIVR